MKILMVSPEAVPFSKSGGLADVVGALSAVLRRKGHDARIILPAYNARPEDRGEPAASFSVHMLGGDEQVEVRTLVENGVPYHFICHPWFCDRKGIYGDTSFEPYTDNFRRFSLMCKAALEFCEATGYKPDILHCHDWTAGLVPVFLKNRNTPFFADTKTVFTIHNLAYQGCFPRMEYLFSDEKPYECIFQGTQVNLMQAGIAMSDRITTVSATYAEEIKTEEQGCGLNQLICARQSVLSGIVNGIDMDEWDPTKDPLIPYRFSATKLEGKAKVKAEVQRRYGLEVDPKVPLFAMISRLAVQKGYDILLPCLDRILKGNRMQFVVIGTGDRAIAEELHTIASANANMAVDTTFSNQGAHLLEAGADFFLMPSKYEPCGLNQLYSLRYGTIPIARRTGGLADTIIDYDLDNENGTGLLFRNLTEERIERHVRRAVELYGRSSFPAMVRRAMQQDFSWDASAEKYVEVYEGATGRSR